MQFVELAVGFVEVGIMELDEAQLFLLHLLAAVVVELQGLVMNDLGKGAGGVGGRGRF
ncbi:MAG: hypothetical protein AAGG02_17640 [Cyanobacteria bacterium P01_H01_bin.15]